MEKIGIIVFNKAIIPENGQEVLVESRPDSTDEKRIAVAFEGIDCYAAVNDAIISQVPGIVDGHTFFDTADFAHNKVTGQIVDVVEFENSVGRTNFCVVLETSVTPLVQKNNSATKSDDVDEVEIEFRGSVTAYPEKGAVIDKIKKGEELTEKFTLKKQNSDLILYYGDAAMGENMPLPEDVKNRLKVFDDDAVIPAELSGYSVGKIKVKIALEDLKLDTSSAFDAERQYAATVGVSEEDFDTYVDLMVNVYQMPVKLVKLVINSWTPINNNYLERYISLDRIAVKDKKGVIHPLYLDQNDNVRRSVAYLVSGKENICFKGEASVGKNILIETLAGLFRKPLLRESLSGGSDLGVLLGDRTVNNDNTVGFDPSQLVKAAEDGCWIVLDEVNTVQTEFLTVLHSLLESDIRAINVPFYKYVKASSDFRVLATMNPVDTGEYIGTKELNSATASRFKTLEIKSTVGFEDVLKNACPKANKNDVKSVARVYAAIKKIYDSRASELSPGFLAIRRYTSILNDDVANEFISLKERCIDSLVQANPNDRLQSEIVSQTINDIIG